VDINKFRDNEKARRKTALGIVGYTSHSCYNCGSEVVGCLDYDRPILCGRCFQILCIGSQGESVARDTQTQAKIVEGKIIKRKKRYERKVKP